MYFLLNSDYLITISKFRIFKSLFEIFGISNKNFEIITKTSTHFISKLFRNLQGDCSIQCNSNIWLYRFTFDWGSDLSPCLHFNQIYFFFKLLIAGLNCVIHKIHFIWILKSILTCMLKCIFNMHFKMH